MRSLCFYVFVGCIVSLSFLPHALGQQTLGSMNGTVTDSSGAVIQKALVKARNVATNLEITARTGGNGSFSISDLPIGGYEVSFTKDGFETSVYPQILLQGNRTTTVNAVLQAGAEATSITVAATPLLNQTDTTTGYVLDDKQIAEVPLGTGSFTQAAILSPGVNADFLNTAGTNAGLGNQAIWANGQRDTSNSFSLNGVNTDNIFNGKSTSQVTSGRVAVNIGQNTNAPGGEIGTSTSVYGAIGQALPSPPPETIQELHVNSALYDASQGSKSGAQIEVLTKSGTNKLHGGAYESYQSAGFNANQWFFNHDSLSRPALNRNVFGGYAGGPIKKDKLFFFASYQGQRVQDQLLGNSLVAVPPDLTDARDAASLAAVANRDFLQGCGTPSNPPCITPGQITPQALALLQLKAPGGSYFIPSAATDPTQLANLQGQNADAIIQGSKSRFTADQVNGNIDYLFSPRDRLAGKYYFQRDPNVTPFANSQLLGFPQKLDAGSQTFSLDNTTSVTPNLTWGQTLGFVRERAFANTSQFIAPSAIGLSIPGSNFFPQINLKNADNVTFSGLSIGPTDNFANAGVFQNNYEVASNLQWVRGIHSIAVGFNFGLDQLNVINKNNQVARVTFADFPGFLLGQICGPNTTSCGGQDVSQILNGATSRYYRSKQVGAYVQDKIRVQANFTLNFGLRWDWDGPLTEKYGNLTNFYPQDYSYNVATDTVNNIGLVVAGNNRVFGTRGVSDSTLTGRQWGFAPRLGFVYSPTALRNVVIRGGFGMYYDRGEYFTELSSPAGGGISGPFGVTVSEPFVTPFYATQNSFAAPFGNSVPPPPSSLSQVKTLVPNAGQLVANTTTFCNNSNQSGCGPFFFGGYDPHNKLPYSSNWTLDLQWQPINTVVMTLGYVGNHGFHEPIPLPFNQAKIATPNSPALAGGPFQQNYSYGYNVPGLSTESVSALVDGFGAGNVALRVPYIGYDPNSVFSEAVGISNYDALQVGVNKRFSRGLQVTGSYTYSHTLDEQSGLGLFFSGNDPNNPASSYGNSDFDRTHVFTASYHYEFPTLHASKFVEGAVNGWGLNGITVLQSGQPYSVFDFSGGAASIYWGGGQDAATNPIVPVGGLGATASNPNLQGTTGVNGNKPVLNAAAFGIPTPFAPGTNGVPPCEGNVCDTFENGYASGGRNIFRAPFQARFDVGAFKLFKITENLILRYDVNAFNIFNHPSFDVPNNNVEFNPGFCNPPSPNSSCSGTGYSFPPAGQLGQLTHTIGSPRFIQMALHLEF